MSGTGKFQTSGILGIENAMPHILYDLSLPLKERREKALLFRSIGEAARYLGKSNQTVVNNREPGKRIKCRRGKEYAVRVATPEMIERLNK